MKRTIKVLFAVMALSLSQVSVEAACKRTATKEVGGPAGKRTAAEEVVSIVFHNIPVNQQSKERGKLNRCGYHALFNAARFARVFASPENLGLSTLEARITHFGQTVFGSLFNREPIETLNNAIEGEGGWGLRIRPDGNDLGGLSEQEITRIIDGGGAGAGSLKSRCDEGILSIWGSMTDFENSMGEWFSYDRMGRSMRALQEGRPVGFCVCLNEEVATASGGSRAGGGGGVWHWVSFGVQLVGADVHVFTMDSLSEVTTDELVIVDDNVVELPSGDFLTTPVTRTDVHFTPALNRRIAAVVTAMLVNDLVRLAIEHTLAMPCDSLIWRIASADGSTQVSSDGLRSVAKLGAADYSDVESDVVAELVKSVMGHAFESILAKFPGSEAIIADIVSNVFEKFDDLLGGRSGTYSDKTVEVLASYMSL